MSAEQSLSFGAKIDLRRAFEFVPAPIEWLMTGLARGYAAGLIAPGGSSKGWLLLQVCCEIATGGAYHDIGMVIDLPPRRVLYLAAEEDVLTLQHRLYAIAAHVPHPLREIIYHNVDVQSTLGRTPSLMNHRLERNEKVVKEIIDYAKAYDVIVFDPLRKFHDGDENSSADITVVTKIFDQIASDARCAVIFAHHANKFSTMNGNGGDAGASRGSMAIGDNIRLQLNLSKLDTKRLEQFGLGANDAQWYVAMDFAKMNHAAPEGTRILHRRADGTLYRDTYVEEMGKISRPIRKRKTSTHLTRIGQATGTESQFPGDDL